MNQTELQTKWKPASDPAFGKCFVYIRETSRELWRAVSWVGLPAPPPPPPPPLRDECAGVGSDHCITQDERNVFTFGGAKL